MKNDKGGQMKDLDFDELHEAVNKLMVQAQKPKAKREPAKSVAKAVSRPTVKVAERSAQEDAAPKPTETEKEKPVEQDDAPVNITVRSKSSAKVLPKKRGMAMDVVQTAKSSAVAPPSARAARTAPTLQPTGPVAPEAPKPRESTVAAPVAEQPQPTEPQGVTEDMLASLNMQTDGESKPKTLLEDDKPAESAFPDPLDVHGFEEEEDAPEEERKPPIVAPEPMAHAPKTDPLLDDTDDTAVQSAWHMPDNDAPKEEVEAPVPEVAPSVAPEPAATPFLNTKVEKRPLGSFAAPPVAPSAAPAPTLSKPESPVVPTHTETSLEKPEPAVVDVPATPEELKPEIVAVESAEADYSKGGWEKPQEDEPLGNLRQMSIPQQHHGHDKQPSKDERPIFDTKDYHPPLQPVGTAKHHTGSKAGAVLTLILIILLVAAGIGAYFVATGSIDLTSFL